MDNLALGDARFDARLDRALEDLPEPIGAPALADPRQRGMIRQDLVQTVSGKPANRDVHLGFPHQSAIVDNAEEEARQHQPHRDFGVDPGPAVVIAIKPRHLRTQPAQVEHPIDPRQDMVIRDQLPQRSRDEQLQLTAVLLSQHLARLSIQGPTS